jgi:hypothetical protein
LGIRKVSLEELNGTIATNLMPAMEESIYAPGAQSWENGREGVRLTQSCVTNLHVSYHFTLIKYTVLAERNQCEYNLLLRCTVYVLILNTVQHSPSS